MLHKLKKHGLIQWEPRRSIRLTQEGRTIAKQLSKKYKKLRTFFLETLKLEDKDAIDKICCELEHHLDFKIIKALDNSFS